VLGIAEIDAGLCDREPASTVDFGNFEFAFAAWRPLDDAGVADQRCRVAIAGEGPGGYHFASGLADASEVEIVAEFARCREAGLFHEFAAGGFESWLGVGVFAFGDCPRALIFFGPDRAAWVD